MWTRSQIDRALTVNPVAVEIGIVRLWEMGFRGYRLRKLLKWVAINRGCNPPGRRLWGGGLAEARNICLFYADHLTAYANRILGDEFAQV